MKSNRILLLPVFLMLVLFGLTACKNNKGNDKSSSDKIEVSKQKDTVEISLTANDKMRYDISEINVYEGQTIRLTLTHKGKAPKATMGHDFTLLKKGVSVQRFARKAAKFEDNDYIPKNTDQVIAHTKLLGGGERDTITFEAPAKGEYYYVFTFPGHYPTMHGKFIVK